MEDNVRKERPPGATPRRKRRDVAKHRPDSRQSKSTAEKRAPVSGALTGSTHTLLGMPINSKTARQAVILSEIIGKPVSKRGKRKRY